MTVFSFVLGACMGSFVFCLTNRRLDGRTQGGRSCCDRCHAILHWYDLVPVVSWLCLKGRCRYCGGKIPVTSVIVESLMGVLYALTCSVYGISSFTILLLCLMAVVMSLSIEDIHQYTIHDVHHVLLIVCRVVYAIALQERTLFLFVVDGIVVMAGVYVLSWIMQQLLHKECLGMGDVKLLGCIGLYAGIEGTWLVCALASFSALVVAMVLRKNKLPFGPFLGWGLLVVLTACGGMVYCIR